MYHELITLANSHPKNDLSLHTGFWSFDLNGIRERGNVKRIGESTLTVVVSDVSFDMPVLEFLNSNPVKL